MTDILEEAREYLEKTKGISDAEWIELQDVSYGSINGIKMVVRDAHREHVFKRTPYTTEDFLTEKDHDAMMLTPTARYLIQSLVKELEKNND